MRIKGSWRYKASLNGKELGIIKTALELLDEAYNRNLPFININRYVDEYSQCEVQSLLNTVEHEV